MFPTKFVVAVIVAAAIALPFEAVTAGATSIPQFPACHNDSTQVKQTSEKGGPAKLPGSAGGNRFYYYVTFTAGCPGDALGSTVIIAITVQLTNVLSGTIPADGMCWRIETDLGYHKPPLQIDMLMGLSVAATYTHAIAGQKYRIRIANLENGLVVQDRATVDG